MSRSFPIPLCQNDFDVFLNSEKNWKCFQDFRYVVTIYRWFWLMWETIFCHQHRFKWMDGRITLSANEKTSWLSILKCFLNVCGTTFFLKNENRHSDLVIWFGFILKIVVHVESKQKSITFLETFKILITRNSWTETSNWRDFSVQTQQNMNHFLWFILYV